MSDPGTMTLAEAEQITARADHMSRAARACAGLTLPADVKEGAVKDLVEAAKRAEWKLAAYVGVCKDDKELTNTIQPMLRAALRALGVPE